jgi:hypothetical protein
MNFLLIDKYLGFIADDNESHLLMWVREKIVWEESAGAALIRQIVHKVIKRE